MRGTGSIAFIGKGKGTVWVKAEVCKGCRFCIDFCTSRALEFSRDYNLKGYRYPRLIHPEYCTGCNTCGSICPDFAIFGMRFSEMDRRRLARQAPELASRAV